MIQNISRKSSNVFWGIFTLPVTLTPLMCAIQVPFSGCWIPSGVSQTTAMPVTLLSTLVSQLTFNSNSIFSAITFLFFFCTSYFIVHPERLRGKSNYSSGVILTPTGPMQKVSLVCSLNFTYFKLQESKLSCNQKRSGGGGGWGRGEDTLEISR